MVRGRYLCFALVNLLAFQYQLKYDLGGTGAKLVTIEVATGTSLGVRRPLRSIWRRCWLRFAYKTPVLVVK
jgi:hypothetical protein